MDREIKFRGKRTDNDQWIYGGFHYHKEVMLGVSSQEQFDKNNKSLIVMDGMSDWNLSVPINCYEVFRESVGQYTGLKDRNEKEIYEGDIVKRSAGKFGDVISLVEYNSITAMFTTKLNDSNYNDTCLSDYDYEVIGNIYENPDLVKSGTDITK